MKSLQSYAALLEKIFLVGLLAGGIFYLLKAEPFDITVTAVSLFGLALAFFLSAYKREMPEGQVPCAKELVAFVILPKVLWLSSSVSAAVLALLVLGADIQIYQGMLFIGGSTIAVAVVIAIFVSLMLKQAARVLGYILIRALPVLVAILYFLMR